MAYLSLYCGETGVSYTCHAICSAMKRSGANLELHAPGVADEMDGDFIRTPFPNAFVQKVAYKAERYYPFVRRISDRRFLSRLVHDDVLYIWPGTNFDLRSLKAAGYRIVVEQINCHQVSARRILDQVFQAAGLPARSHNITDFDIEREIAGYEGADYIFSPSPATRASLLENGVPATKILATSYGWDPRRLQGQHRLLEPAEGITIVFLGTVGFRKGAHHLLAAWQRAKIPGRLLLVGEVEPLFERKYANWLHGENVIRLPFQRDIGAVLRSADAFVLPSYEEGSPLVIYEAMSQGLPSLLSPMAAGDVARDRQECLVIQPGDDDGWAEALHLMHDNPALRQEMGRAAKIRSGDYTWAKVGQARIGMLQDKGLLC